MKRDPDCSFPVQRLDKWYQANKRDLPWRKNSTPYRTWVSEIMLQQTQVNSVIPYYERFLKRFPDLSALAQATEEQVLPLWSGLGYYSRARNLLKSAKIIEEQYGGKFPDHIQEALKLPGIGNYTAGAILSIAYNQPLPILDGNVRRVLSRFYLEGSQDALWKRSGEIIKSAHEEGILPSDFNQALMEIGALVCLPKSPLCGQCPLSLSCGAKLKNLQEEFPPAAKKQKTVQKEFAVLIARRKNKAGIEEYFIRQRPKTDKWLKNMWEFPMIEIDSKVLVGAGFSLRAVFIQKTKTTTTKARRLKPAPTTATTLQKNISELFHQELSFPVKILSNLGTVLHSITNNRLKISVLEGEVKSNGTSLNSSMQWVPQDRLQEYSSSSILKKSLALISRI